LSVIENSSALLALHDPRGSWMPELRLSAQRPSTLVCALAAETWAAAITAVRQIDEISL
jgi:hypothetical protein